ncbi:hypothetical protein [Microbulbifer epialgicus]|uniref:DUF695 domain-containing protein n=1 Tax=Microbulbifer epialgicus TaxID=393907 RepID=A0ABV4P3N9_9GAMM
MTELRDKPGLSRAPVIVGCGSIEWQWYCHLNPRIYSIDDYGFSSYLDSVTEEVLMRLLMKILIPAKQGDIAVADESMPAVLNAFIAAADPESSYFYLENGKRAAIFIFEEKRQDKLMAYNEKFFAKLDAAIWITPVLNHKELQKHL